MSWSEHGNGVLLKLRCALPQNVFRAYIDILVLLYSPRNNIPTFVCFFLTCRSSVHVLPSDSLHSPSRQSGFSPENLDSPSRQSWCSPGTVSILPQCPSWNRMLSIQGWCSHQDSLPFVDIANSALQICWFEIACRSVSRVGFTSRKQQLGNCPAFITWIMTINWEKFVFYLNYIMHVATEWQLKCSAELGLLLQTSLQSSHGLVTVGLLPGMGPIYRIVLYTVLMPIHW